MKYTIYTLLTGKVRKCPDWNKGLFIFTKSRPSMGPTDTPSRWLLGLFLGGKVAEAWCCSPPSRAEVNNRWTYTSVPLPICLCGVGRNYSAFIV